MSVPLENSRPTKLNHTQTILYEIDMLRFAAQNFGQVDGWSSWSNLECFLLHFRNLIEFFGKPADDRDTLSILKPESFSKDQQLQEELKKLYRNDLWAKYEVRHNGEENDKISRYLQHCTEERVNDKSWKVREMFLELSPLIERFEKALPDEGRPWNRVPDKDLITVAMMQESCGTATVAKGGMFAGLDPMGKRGEPE
jgi:hypothetical protein